MTPDLPAAGNFAVDATALELEPAELDPSQIVEGDPRVAERVVWSSPDGGDPEQA